MDPTTRFRVNAPGVVHQIIDGEAVVIDLVRGNYYSLERTAAEVWGWLDNGASAGEMADGLAASYEGDRDAIGAALATFLGGLEAEGLIAALAEPPATADAPLTIGTVNLRLPFEAPRFSKFTDMQDLLLLDPIHEVDASGWPRARTP